MAFAKGDNIGENNVRWNGGRFKDNTFGYVFLKKPGHPNADVRGYVREHVYNMSEHLGRPIAKNEVVHHINGIKDDNRLENLQVMLRSVHNTHHHKGIRNQRKLANLELRPEKKKPLKICEYCHREFYRRGTPRHEHIFCSLLCANRYRVLKFTLDYGPVDSSPLV